MLDEMDKTILGILIEDARISLKELSQKSGSRLPACPRGCGGSRKRR